MFTQAQKQQQQARYDRALYEKRQAQYAACIRRQVFTINPQAVTAWVKVVTKDHSRHYIASAPDARGAEWTGRVAVDPQTGLLLEFADFPADSAEEWLEAMGVGWNRIHEDWIVFSMPWPVANHIAIYCRMLGIRDVDLREEPHGVGCRRGDRDGLEIVDGVVWEHGPAGQCDAGPYGHQCVPLMDIPMVRA